MRCFIFTQPGIERLQRSEQARGQQNVAGAGALCIETRASAMRILVAERFGKQIDDRAHDVEIVRRGEAHGMRNRK